MVKQTRKIKSLPAHQLSLVGHGFLAHPAGQGQTRHTGYLVFPLRTSVQYGSLYTHDLGCCVRIVENLQETTSRKNSYDLKGNPMQETQLTQTWGKHLLFWSEMSPEQLVLLS